MNNLKPYFYIISLLVLITLSSKLAENLILIPLLEAAYNGESFEYLNKLITHHHLKNPDVRNLEFYQTEAPKYINRILFLTLSSTLLLWIVFKNNFLIFKEFLFEKKSGFSISVLRISIIGLIIYINFPVTAYEISSLGAESIVPPMGWSKGLISLLINEYVVISLSVLFYIFCLGGLLGIYTNFMLRGAAIVGFFIMGIPQFFGKIDHYHSLWHVLLVLSFSNSGNSLSIDSWRKKLPQINLNKSTLFGFSSKIIMILIGLSYFFPGFWKFTFSGLEWAFSNNLQLKLHSKWLDLDGWTPFFRIDRFPILYQSAAFSTMIIELGFIFALFFKRTRLVFIIGALSFHISVAYFMRISFFSLMVLYVVFVNWDWIIKTFLPKKNYLEGVIESTKLDKKVIWVSGILVLGNLISGATLINSWPFALYPTFASIESETVPSILITGVDQDGNKIHETIPFLDKKYREEFTSSSTLRGYIDNLIKSGTGNTENFSVLAQIFINSNKLESKIVSVRFYKIRLNTNPDSVARVNEIQELIFESLIFEDN